MACEKCNDSGYVLDPNPETRSYNPCECTVSTLDRIEAVANLLKRLHRSPDLTGQDRSNVMIASELLHNLTPFRKYRDKILAEMVSQDFQPNPSSAERCS